MKKMLIIIMLTFSSITHSADSLYWVNPILKPMLFKSTLSDAEKKLQESAVNSGWFEHRSAQIQTESMSDGRIAQICIYGPSDNPWLVMYAIDGILVKYKTLNPD